jgi:hypothetical protein
MSELPEVHAQRHPVDRAVRSVAFMTVPCNRRPSTPGPPPPYSEYPVRSTTNQLSRSGPDIGEGSIWNT